MTTKSEGIIRNMIVEQVFVQRQKDSSFRSDNNGWLMDFRRVCLDPDFLDAYTDIFYERFKDRYPFQVGGMEVAAIPLVAAIIMKMRERGMPVNGFFIRKSRKKTGLLKMIEGKLTDAPVILVDDLINSGYTLDRQLKVLSEAKCTVVSYFVLLRFRELSEYEDKYQKMGIEIETLYSLADFQESLGTKLLSRSPVPAESFSVAWYFKSPGARLEQVIPKSGLVSDGQHLYFGSDSGIVYALRQSDGKVVWQHRIGLGTSKNKEIFSTLVFSEDKIFFGAYDGNIYCLEAATGKRLWVSFEADWVHGSLAFSSALRILFVPVVFGTPGKRGGILALHPDTGKVLWRSWMESALRSAPLVVDKTGGVYIGSENGTLSMLDAKTGKLQWSFRSGGAIKDMPVYDIETQHIVFSSFDGAVYCLRAQDGLLVWKFENGGLANYSAPCIWKQRIFFASLDKHLYCLDSTTGQKLWSVPARARIFSSPRVYDGQLYFGANDARLYVLDPVTGKQNGFFQAVERITSPVLMDTHTGKVFLQTYANEVYCLIQKRVDKS